MPQIWMTYQELAMLCGYPAEEARSHAEQLLLDRRRSRDGHTRVKLNAELMARFLEAIRESDAELDAAIAALRDTHRRMSGVFSARRLDDERGAA